MRSGKKSGPAHCPCSEDTAGKRGGFSLLELLAMMTIMAMLTTLAVTSYFSAISGMARRSAVKHVVNTLILARQRACMEGARVSVMFFDEFHGYEKDESGKQTSTEVSLPSYVVCKELGQISYINGQIIGDEFKDLDKMFGVAGAGQWQSVDDSFKGQIRLYNLTKGGWWNVKPYVKGTTLTRTSPLDGAEDELSCYYFVVVKKQVLSPAIGDSYGIEAAPVGSLPKGFVFNGLTDQSSDPICINFLPDGRCDTSNGGKGSITIVETRLPSKRPSNTISVDSQGNITFGETWN